MLNTSKRHWVNGHQIRGGYFHTLNLSLFNIGLMISWGGGLPKLETFKLIK